MGEVSPASFADVTFALIQKVSPRKIKRSDIPNEAFHALREMVSSELSSISNPHFVAASPSGAPSNGNASDTVIEPIKQNFGLFEDEDSRMSGCESSEGSQSQFSIEEEPQKLLVKNRAVHYSSSASSLSQLTSSTKPLKQSTKARRLTELRAARRKAAETDETHVFACTEENLPTVFGEWYDGLLDANEQPVKCYQLIANSLKKFFVTNTFGNAVETMVGDFLKAHVVRSCAELNSHYESSPASDADRRLRETQLQILLELYISYLDPSASSRLPEIVKKMRIVYFVANPSRMRTFLEEQVADNFVHLVPKLVAEIFDELCIQLPHDLEEYDSVWNKDDDLSFPLFNQKAGTTAQLQQIDQLIEEVQPQEQEAPVNGKAKGAKKKAEQHVESAPVQTENTSESPPRKTSQRKSSRLHAPRTIPETPEEKLRERVKEENNEVVKATPMAKVCGNPKRRHSRLTELVRISEERAKIPRAAAIASAKACKAMIQATQSIVPTTRESLLGLHTPSPRPQRAKSNLLSKFANTVNKDSKSNDAEVPMRVLRSSSTSQNNLAKRATDSKPNSTEPPEKKSRLTSSASAPAIAPATPNNNVGIDDILGKEQLLRFQRRVDEINKIKEADEDEVYCEPILRRTSLFDEEVVTPPNGKMQQNRTRRVVTASSAAHLAHTLLNVDNDTPLQVWKLPKNLQSPEKMPRMIRTGLSAVKMKKIQRMREQSTSTPSTPGSHRSERSNEAESLA
ncbi:unnamed protein product [Cylicocyclus nassatus]|uniref:Treslin STD domain-containing protein n=1 Tax=Cylicocyclus nassatus TaxID=53992 RepID=A0AA36GQ25_CYLNA|nr:unnamed protein product [Cylicocyclus nassatus]